MPNPVVIATWPFGQTAARIALPLLAKGQPALDAGLAGAQAVEDDPKVNSVGYGGVGNAVGTVSLDACVMDGKTLACGGVAAVENVRHVAALARRVMEKTPHVLLVGEGARLFAVRQGFPLETLNTPESVAEWEKTKPKAKKETSTKARDLAPRGTFPSDSHDTVTVLALDPKGRVGAAATSGTGFQYAVGRKGKTELLKAKEIAIS